MDIFIPNRKLWTPAESMSRCSRITRNLTPHRVMMGAAGAMGDRTSYLLDGTGDYLSVPDSVDWFMGEGDFTLEGWFYFNSLANDISLFAQYESVENRMFCKLDGASGELITFLINDTDASKINITGTHGISADTWHHIAIVNNSSAVDIYIDGSSIINGTMLASGWKNLSVVFSIGSSVVALNDMNGYIDEFRVSDIARWTTDFTPETSQYTSDANTLLLIHCGETKTGTTGSGATFTDSGNTGHTVTEVGNAIEDTSIYKF